jgi:hypothetical protein
MAAPVAVDIASPSAVRCRVAFPVSLLPLAAATGEPVGHTAAVWLQPLAPEPPHPILNLNSNLDARVSGLRSQLSAPPALPGCIRPAHRNSPCPVPHCARSADFPHLILGILYRDPGRNKPPRMLHVAHHLHRPLTLARDAQRSVSRPSLPRVGSIAVTCTPAGKTRSRSSIAAVQEKDFSSKSPFKNSACCSTAHWPAAASAPGSPAAPADLGDRLVHRIFLGCHAQRRLVKMHQPKPSQARITASTAMPMRSRLSAGPWSA